MLNSGGAYQHVDSAVSGDHVLDAGLDLLLVSDVHSA
jgi:hypothetical protein